MLYFKVDDSNRDDYERRGMKRFGPMNYYAVPEEVLDDPGELRGWVERAITVTARNSTGKRRR